MEWRKGKPLVNRIRARLLPKQMPVNVVHDADGLPRILLTEPSGSSAEVLLHGGQVKSWKNDRRKELLLMSSKVLV